MGRTIGPEKDTEGFGQDVKAIRQLISAASYFAQLDETARVKLGEGLIALVTELRESCPEPKTTAAFGWKRPITVFAVEAILDRLPDAKVIHLIRDGRDVMLSRLGRRMAKLHRSLNRLVVFGDRSIESYRGKPLDRETIDEHRNEIEMHHWVTAVQAGMRGRAYPDRYIEVRYEELCAEPVITLERLFEFLDVPFLPETRRWITENASTRSIGKWRGRESELAEAIQIGQPLLSTLGYV